MTADLQPTPMSRHYSINIDYNLGVSPEVRVVTPKLQLHPEAEELPHTFPGDKLCLHLPGEWSPAMHIAKTTVPWTSEWLFYYEIWLITGNWHGGGHGEPPGLDQLMSARESDGCGDGDRRTLGLVDNGGRGVADPAYRQRPQH